MGREAFATKFFCKGGTIQKLRKLLVHSNILIIVNPAVEAIAAAKALKPRSRH
jgi:hypothetical protein